MPKGRPKTQTLKPASKNTGPWEVIIHTTHTVHRAEDEADARDQALAELQSQLNCGDIPDDIQVFGPDDKV